MTNKTVLDLITLYTATKEIRESRTQEQRARNNKMMVSANNITPFPSGDQQQQTVQTFELQPQIKELCRTLNGFIFVVDVTLSLEEIDLCLAELHAMTNEQWCLINTPILILACVPHINSIRTLSSFTLVERLQLQKLQRSFQVRNCTVDTMDGIEEGFHWLVSTCHQN
jgi:F-box protein 4